MRLTPRALVVRSYIFFSWSAFSPEGRSSAVLLFVHFLLEKSDYVRETMLLEP